MLKFKEPIVVMTHPKSGTHWLMFIVFNYLTDKENIFSNTSRLTTLNKIQFETNPYNISFVHAINPNGFKSVHLTRDPIDTLISHYYFLKERINPFAGMDISKQERWLNSIDNFILDRMPDLMMKRELADKNCDYKISYEELKEDAFGAVKKLFEFLELEVDEERLKRAIKRASFENIRKVSKEKNQQGGAGKRLEMKKDFVFCRDGRVGQRSCLKEETLNKLKHMGVKW